MRDLLSGGNPLSSIVLAIALGMIVWMAATSAELSRVTFPSTQQERGIPIELINVPEGLTVIAGDDERLLVDLMIPSEQVGELEAADILATADLQGLAVGSHQVEVRIERNPLAPRFKQLSLRPNRITVTLDELVRVTLPVSVDLRGEATIPQNYRVLTPTVEPPEVTLIGPSSRVEPITDVVAVTSIIDARESVEQEVTLALRSEGRPLSQDLLTEPLEPVLVTVPIEKRQGFRELIVHPTLAGEPAVGFWVSEFSVEPDIVTVVGQPAVVDALDSIVDTDPIDVSAEGEGEVTRKVPLQLPPGVETLNEGEGEVTVRIRIEPQTYSRVVTLEPKVAGLDPDYAVPTSAIVPSKVDVLLKGSLIELDALSIDQIDVTLDLTGLEPGIHLIRPTITPPGTLRVESILPEQIEVTIVEQRASRELTVPLTISGLAPATIAIASPVTVSVTISGTTRLLDTLDEARLRASLVLQRPPPGTVEATPALDLRNELSVTQIEPERVSVGIYQSADVRVVTREIDLVGLGAGLEATANTNVAIVRALGPGSAATLSQNPQFQLRVDLTGLPVGEYRLRPLVLLPPGYQLLDVVPARIVVQVE